MADTEKSAEMIEQPNSCEISVNAKGEIAFKVKAYSSSLIEAMIDAQTKAVEMRNFVERWNKKEAAEV